VVAVTSRLGVSVKMNVLLFLPGFALILAMEVSELLIYHLCGYYTRRKRLSNFFLRVFVQDGILRNIPRALIFFAIQVSSPLASFFPSSLTATVTSSEIPLHTKDRARLAIPCTRLAGVLEGCIRPG